MYRRIYMKNKISKSISILLVLFLMVISFVGCNGSKDTGAIGDDKKQDEKKVTYLYVHATNTLNPHLKASGNIPIRTGAVETLVRIDEDLKLKPWLLEKWNSKDAKHWEFKVRKGIKFHNGTSLDANIVKANIEACIKNNPGIKNALNIESMEAKEDILKIVTKKPNASLPSEFVHPNTAIIDVNASDIDTKPCGTGAFKVENFKPNSSIQLVKNDKYWDGEVKVDKVNFEFNQDANARLQALQSGYADIIFKPAAESIETLKKDSKVTIDTMPGLRTNELLYNIKKPLTGNEYFRKGLDSLINRKEIVENIMSAQATIAYGPFMEGLPFAIDYKKNQFGLDKALENFKKAGLTVTDGKVLDNGKPIKLKVVTYASRAELPPIAQLVQSNAKKIGIEMNISIVEGENVDNHLKSDDWDFCVYSLLTAPRGDAGYYLNSSIKPEGSLNHGYINDDKLTAIINEFNSCIDETKQNELAKQATTIINKKNYNSYVAYPNVIVAYNNQRISNWKTSPSEFYMITKDLDVK
ncbi:ABC transporter substrate-binding protein [Clostridium tetani]|nr:ABC transporter substrate-binding protein [Clostridium tetani]